MTSDQMDRNPGYPPPPPGRLRIRELLLVLAGLAIAAGFQATWYIAPQLLKTPMWPGSAIPLSLPLCLFAILAPLILAWLCAQGDGEADSSETYAVARHG